MNYTILAAEKNDLPEILQLQKTAYAPNGERYNNPFIQPLTQTLEDLAGDYEKGIFLKAVCDGIIIGSVRGRCEKGTLYLAKLMVHPDFQNRGVARALVRKLESVFRDAKRVELFTGERDEKNVALYKKLGFQIFSEKEDEGIRFFYMEKECNGDA